LEGQLAALAGQVEAAQEKHIDLADRRDTAQRAYQAVSRQIEEVRLLIALNGPTVRQAALAVAPRAASSPRPRINAVLGALLGFMLAVLYVVGREWWRGPARS